MKRVEIKDENGRVSNAFIPESNDELKKQLNEDRKQTLKEHLYIGYLMIGTIAFSLGILISLRRLKGQ